MKASRAEACGHTEAISRHDLRLVVAQHGFEQASNGSFASNLNDGAPAAAILGLAESMIRERIIAERTGAANPFSDAEISTVFEALMNGVAAKAS